MIYYPLNWIPFLFSDENLLSAITFRSFLEVFLIGVCAYRFFLIELKSRVWALFSSIAYQMCSLLIFTFTIFPTTSLYFVMTLYLYLLWSAPYRKTVWNYVFITLTIYLILTSANVAFVFYGCLALAVVTLYRFVTADVDKSKSVSIVFLTIGAVLTAVLLAAIRIIPCAIGISNSNRIVDHFYTLHDRFALITRLFVPQITGWYGYDIMSSSPDLKMIYKMIDMPWNIQDTFFVYFGVVPALLWLISFFIKGDRRFRFWQIYAFVVLGMSLLWQPIWGVFSILFFPFNHYSYHTIIIPVGFCALCGHAGVLLQEKKFEIHRLRNVFLFGVLIVLAFLFVIMTYTFPYLANAVRVVLFGMISWIAIYWSLDSRRNSALDQFRTWSRICLEGTVLVTAFLVFYGLLMKPVTQEFEGLRIFAFPLSLIMMALWLSLRCYEIWLWREEQGKQKGRRVLFGMIAVFIMIIIIILSLIRSSIFARFLESPEGARNYFILLSFGVVHFLMIVFMITSAVRLCVRNKISQRLLWGLVLGVLISDLAIFYVRYHNFMAPQPMRRSFYVESFPYLEPHSYIKKLTDPVNYRFDSLHLGGVNANKNLIFGLPSYTGILGYMPKIFTEFIVNFGYPPTTKLIYPSDTLGNDRFLDLSAVRYKFEKDGQRVIVRPNSLARLNLIYAYEVSPDKEQALRAIRHESFDFHSIALLSKPLDMTFLSRVRPSVMVPIQHATSDRVEAQVDTEFPAILLFVETYDRGWKAFVDGQETPIVPANVSFMACALPEGRHKVTFVYQPKSFYVSAMISLGGFLIFIATAIFLYSRKEKKF
jgi:hypothetical protein